MISPSGVVCVGVGIIGSEVTLVKSVNLFILIPSPKLAIDYPMVGFNTICTRRVRIYRIERTELVNLLVEH